MRISTYITIVASIICFSSSVEAAPVGPVPHTIAMTGEGSVTAMPDRADVSAGVQTHAKTAGAAMDANRVIMNRVFDAIAALGIPKDAVETSSFSLEPEYPPEDPKNPQPREINGYEVSNSVNVTVSDITKVGAVLDALISAGANQSAGVSFSVKNPHPLLVATRAAAARDALERARTYAHEVGAELGPVISIREGNSAVIGSNLESVVVTAERRPTPINAGEQSIEAQVTVVWALK